MVELTHTKEVSERADPQSLQRISAARRLLHRRDHGYPDVIILDEPMVDQPEADHRSA